MSKTDDALSHGFDAGNYANAYESERFGKAWGNVKREGTYKEWANASERQVREAFRGAFYLGFYSSYENHEVPEDRIDELLAAEQEYGSRMRELGIAVDERSSDGDSCPHCGSDDLEDTPAGPACHSCGVMVEEY